MGTGYPGIWNPQHGQLLGVGRYLSDVDGLWKLNPVSEEGASTHRSLSAPGQPEETEHRAGCEMCSLWGSSVWAEMSSAPLSWDTANTAFPPCLKTWQSEGTKAHDILVFFHIFPTINTNIKGQHNPVRNLMTLEWIEIVSLLLHCIYWALFHPSTSKGFTTAFSIN